MLLPCIHGCLQHRYKVNTSMLSLFLNQHRRLENALKKDDLKTFRNRLSITTDIEAKSLALSCITLAKPDFLAAVMEHKAARPLDFVHELAIETIKSPSAAPLLSTLLKAGLSPNTLINDEPLAAHVIKQPYDHAMVLLSLLNQHGLDLNEIPSLLTTAIHAGERPLIKYLIESGMVLEKAKLEDVENELKTYIERLLIDKQLRDSWQ